MEPAQLQLARPLAPLQRNGGTTHPSVHNDRVALGYMELGLVYARRDDHISLDASHA